MIIEYFLFVQVLFVSSFQTYCIAQHTSVETRIHINQYSVLCSCNIVSFHLCHLFFVFFSLYFLNFKRFYLFIFKEGKGRKKRGRETSMCGCLSYIPSGDLVCNPGMHPDWELNWRPFGLQARAKYTE